MLWYKIANKLVFTVRTGLKDALHHVQKKTTVHELVKSFCKCGGF